MTIATDVNNNKKKHFGILTYYTIIHTIILLHIIL